MDFIKIAFFVEGYTEQYFLEKLLSEIFSSKDIAIEIKSISGGSKSPIKYTNIKSAQPNEETKYYVLIYNCGGDSNVKSYILDHRESLIKAGHKKIVGLRDLFPEFQRDEIHKLRMGLNYKVPQKDIKIQFVLSIMEIESWFLAEHSHFESIDQTLTTEHIKATFGLDLKTMNTEEVENAAETLDNIYKSVGKRYLKKTKSIDRTIEVLDYSEIYFETRKRLNSLNELIEAFEEIFE